MTQDAHTERWRLRLLELINALKARDGVSQRAIAEQIGLAPSYLSRLLLDQDRSERRNLGAATMDKISAAYNLPPGWFDLPAGQGLRHIAGNGKPTTHSAVSVDAVSSETSNIRLAEIGSRRIPVISSIQAGHWKEIVDNFAPGDAEDWIYTDLELSQVAFALDIVGYSMIPEFLPGHRVIIDPEVAPRPGDFVAARNGDDMATFKKYRPRGITDTGLEVFELVPLNPDYPTLSSATQHIQIIGTMMEHRKYRPK
ncbi:LexA family protein [Comamonas sediminis]|uniref:LexA family protein n=1 Tax=Comamonas sediminis TaxID=1783360 RepID=UPI003D295C98